MDLDVTTDLRVLAKHCIAHKNCCTQFHTSFPVEHYLSPIIIIIIIHHGNNENFKEKVHHGDSNQGQGNHH